MSSAGARDGAGQRREGKCNKCISVCNTVGRKFESVKGWRKIYFKQT